jgi:biotin operon repressor
MSDAASTTVDEAPTTDVEASTSGESLPERHESQLTDAGEASKEKKREVALEFVRRRDPLVTTNEIEDATGIHRRTVTRAIDGLRQDGIVVERDTGGDTKHYFLKSEYSEYPVPPDVVPYEATDPELMQHSGVEVMTISSKRIADSLFLSSAYLSVFLLFAGSLANIYGATPEMSNLGPFATAAVLVIAMGFALSLGHGIGQYFNKILDSILERIDM